MCSLRKKKSGRIRKSRREKFLQVAQALLGRPVSDDALIGWNQRRYEFKNKGIVCLSMLWDG